MELPEGAYAVEDCGYETPCWIWRGALFTNGYARTGNGPKGVHVLVYEATDGPGPAGYVVHHLCEQKACVRRGHLDRIPRAEHPKLHRKITPELAEEIRRAPGSSRQVARRYGISKTHAHALRSSS